MALWKPKPLWLTRRAVLFLTVLVAGAMFAWWALGRKGQRIPAAMPLGLALVLIIGLGAIFVSARRVGASPEPVRRHLMPPIAILLIGLLLAAGAVVYHQHQQALHGQISAQIATVDREFHVDLRNQSAGIAATAQPIAADPGVQNALREGNAEGLLAVWQPVFESLHRENNFTHFYFLDANRICLLRVHQPERRGDRIDRVTARQAERTGEAASGLELGPMGTLALRVVQPVFQGGKLVGYVELGKEIEELVRARCDSADVELAVLVPKDYLHRPSWEASMRSMGRPADWDRLPHRVVAYASHGRLPDACAAWADPALGDHPHGRADQEIRCEGKDLRIFATPLEDASGVEVGDLIVMRDVSAAKAEFTRLLALGGTTGAVLLALLLGIVYVLLGRTDAGIRAQQAQLRENEESLRKSRLQLAEAMDLAHLVNWEYDRATDCFTFDDRFYALYGTTAAREGSTRMSSAAYAREFVHPDEVQLVAEEIGKAFTTTDTHYRRQIEHRIVRRDGQVRHIVVSFEIVRDAGGRIVGSHGANQDITDRKQAEEALRIERENLKAIFASSPVGMLLLDQETMIVDANSVLAGMVSRSLGQVIHQRGGGGLGCVHSFENEKGCGFSEACPSCALRNALTQVLAAGTSVRGAEIQPTLVIGGQSKRPWLSVSAEPVLLDGHKHVLVAVEDITERKQAEEELRQRTELLQAINAELEAQHLMILAQTREMRALLDGMPGHSFLKARNGQYLAANQMFCKALGKTEEVIVGATDADIFPPDLAQKRLADDQRVFSGELPMLETEDMMMRGDERQWMLTRKIAVPAADGTVERLIGVSIDITARKAMEEELRTAARTDKLTGLCNRALFSDRLQQAVLRAKRLKDYHFAVLFLDFDRFKTVNDSLGHDVGDRLLQEIARRLQTTVRSGDSLSRPMHEHTSARLGGDEFVILLDGIAAPGDATVVANRLLDAFAQPYQLGDHKVYSTASIGVVTSDISADSADDVLRDADTAMYEAKLAGKGQYVMFDISMRQRVQNRLNLEYDLRNALAAGELFIMYQPIVSLHSGDIESFEALLRWKHPVRGLISPAEFIPIAEDTGLILPIGEWVLREACGQFVRWRHLMGAAAPRSISVNLSRNQLVLPDLAQTIHRILDQAGMAPACLHLEVTESAVMKDAAAATRMLRAIRDIGVRLDMDDFGTGHSSLACLHQFPLDVLKIDRSFVANIDRGRDFAALVHAVAQLARNLNISVVAEGIETVEQLMVLQSLECDFGQGYLFSKPLPADNVPHFRVSRGVLPGQAA